MVTPVLHLDMGDMCVSVTRPLYTRHCTWNGACSADVNLMEFLTQTSDPSSTGERCACQCCLVIRSVLCSLRPMEGPGHRRILHATPSLYVQEGTRPFMIG